MILALIMYGEGRLVNSLSQHEVIEDLESIQANFTFVSKAERDGVVDLEDLANIPQDYIDSAPNQELRATLDKIRNAIVADTDTFTQRKRELTRCKGEQAALEKMAKSLDRQISQAQSKLKSKRNEVEPQIQVLKDKFNKNNAIASSLMQKVTHLTSMVNDYNGRVEQVTELKRQSQRKQQYLQMLEDILARAEMQGGSLNSTVLIDMTHRHTELVEQRGLEVACREQRNTDLANRTSLLQHTVAELTSEAETLIQEHRQLTTRLAAQKKHVAEEKARGDMFAKKLKQTQQENAQRVTYKQQHAEHIALFTRLVELDDIRSDGCEDTIKQVCVEIKELQQENKLMCREYSKMLGNYEVLIQGKEKVAEEVAASLAVVNTQRDELQGLNKRMDSANNDMKRIAKKCAKMMGMVEERTEVQNSAQKRTQEVEQKMEACKKEFAALEEAYNACQTKESPEDNTSVQATVGSTTDSKKEEEENRSDTVEEKANPPPPPKSPSKSKSKPKLRRSPARKAAKSKSRKRKKSGY